MKYDPSVHDLGYVIRDLDHRAQKAEDAIRALAAEPGQPFHAAEVALEILDRES